ncbi:MAG: nucleotide-binding protein [Deltaproteobacteria bacterium]|nr:nucleotide-binding protein [Deltaproteobacteria bacterium]
MPRSWPPVVLLAAVACQKTAAPEVSARPPPRPARAAASAPPFATEVSGRVLERIDAATYSYLRLATATGELWAAVPQTTIAVGAEATIAGPAAMRRFESKTLERTFDLIYFGTLLPSAVAPRADGEPAALVAASHVKPAAPAAAAAAADTKVAKAEGAEARTVAEIFAHKSALAAQRVTVRGKVVKFLPSIMQRNWVHLQDGTGTAAAGDHDLTVTTTDTAAVGDIVVVRGVVRLDKDFGSGYAYPVIIEEGAVTRDATPVARQVDERGR